MALAGQECTVSRILDDEVVLSACTGERDRRPSRSGGVVLTGYRTRGIIRADRLPGELAYGTRSGRSRRWLHVANGLSSRSMAMQGPSLFERIAYRVRSFPRSVMQLDRSLLFLGALQGVGWSKSVRLRSAVDKDGQPLPWFTYPAIYWLDGVMEGRERVFEFGSGQSTRWFSRRARSVVSVEHDAAWASRVERESEKLANVSVLFRDCDGDDLTSSATDPYVGALSEQRSAFDIVVVDGRARARCLEVAPECLEAQGLLILDNSDREEYRASLEMLHGLGFARIDFVGPIPGAVNFGSTSVFSRDIASWLRRSRPPRAWPSQIRRGAGATGGL